MNLRTLQDHAWDVNTQMIRLCLMPDALIRINSFRAFRNRQRRNPDWFMVAAETWLPGSYTVILDLNKARTFTESYYRNNLQKRFSFTIRGEVYAPTSAPESQPTPAPTSVPMIAPMLTVESAMASVGAKARLSVAVTFPIRTQRTASPIARSARKM